MNKPLVQKIFSASLIAIIAVSMLPVPRARAATLTVTTNAGGAAAVDGQCSLREAIINANADAATNVDCAAGTGLDTIVFSAAVNTINLTVVLTNITDPDGLIIDGGGDVTVDAGGAFRIFTVTAGAFTVQNITLTNGLSAVGNGGAILYAGGVSLTVSGSTFTGNAALAGGAINYQASPTPFAISNSTFTNNTATTGNGGAILNLGNMTVTNSTFTGNSSAQNGGAIHHSVNSLSISGSTFTGNYASNLFDGGALYIANSTGTPTVNNSIFENQNNINIDDGAGIYLFNGPLEVNGGRFTNNTASDNGGAITVGSAGTLTVGNTSGVTFSGNSAAAGGAIYSDSTTLLSISNSSFSNNRALTEIGGAIAANDITTGSLTVTNSTFTGNTAADDGGAIYNLNEPATITNSAFVNNSIAGTAANTDGGAIRNGAAADQTTILRSSFIGNSITNTNDNNANGGAIANFGANFILANSTFSGNSTNETGAAAGNALGGAVYSNDNATIHNVTFSANSVSDTGTGNADGGNLYRANGTLTVANTILNGGTENGAAGNCGGVITDGGNNISFSSADCGAGFTNSDPLLAALTGTPAYFPINAASPALDGGSNAVCANAATTNNQSQNGVTRPVGLNCDIGSYEVPPVLIIPNVNSNPDTGDASVAENEIILSTLNLAQLLVEFNLDVYDDPADLVNFADDVTNPANYRLLYSNTGSFNTPGCVGGVVAPDIPIPVSTVTYSNGGGSGPFIATLNLSASLTTLGYYRLYVCGTTSVVVATNPTIALAGDGATAGTDFVRNFRITGPPEGRGRGGDDSRISARDLAGLPATGFAPKRVTVLPEQPKELAYADLGDLWIEIPALGVKAPIVGVPLTAESDWDVTWLANNVGWLNGTAFPTWEGNSVLTAHVTNADGLDGPFANLKKLKYGDQIIVHLFDEKYIFEVRNSRLSRPYTTSFAFEHLEEQSYLTLITCQYYLPTSDTYFFRRIIRAVLVEVQSE